MKKKKKTVIFEGVAIEKRPFEKVIDKVMVKHNCTDAVISALKDKYGGLQLKSIDDKESYLEIKKARQEVRKIGILTEKLCKKGREDAIAIQKKWLAKENEILGKIDEVQVPLDNEIKKFEDEVERREIEEQKRKEQVYMNRQAVLSKYGAVYNNGSFELNHISYEVSLIQQADEEQWNGIILPKYRKVYEEIEAERVAEENRRKQEQERLQKEKEAFEEQQRIFRQQQEEFQKQQAELQRQKDEAERKEREQRLQAQREVDAANEKKWRDRLAYLNAIKWNGQEARSGVDDSLIFTYEELLSLPDDTFFERAKDYIYSVALFNKEQEEKRQAKIEADIIAAKELAAQQERERIAEEQRQAEIKKQQEEAKKAEELALSGDKGMYADVIKYLQAYPKHNMKSNIYKGKMNAIAQFIENL
jgi:hypothetical protein